MRSYLVPIQAAFLLFPVLAALFSLPYVVAQYRRYGALLLFRVLVVYSLIPVSYTHLDVYKRQGSKRLFEIADSLTEIKSVCRCGRKAEVNARIKDGRVVKEGEQILIGGNDAYIGMCYNCWQAGKLD